MISTHIQEGLRLDHDFHKLVLERCRWCPSNVGLELKGSELKLELLGMTPERKQRLRV